MTLAQLRRCALARSLFPPTTLRRAIARLGFVQADPIAAPARAQDLVLRHRVRGYRAGDLERAYPRLDVEEDMFVNYGFLPRETQALMHPRRPRVRRTPAQRRRAEDVLAFVRAHGIVHPREVDEHFGHGRTTNWFGGSSRVTTQLLEAMHYEGELRVVRREGGTRVYGVREPWPVDDSALDVPARLDRLVDVIVRKYAPLPAPSLGKLTTFLRSAVPQWAAERRAALTRAKSRLPHARVDGVEWYWAAEEAPSSRTHREPDDLVRILAPFDPVVWDRLRFELFWGWAYRFEAYVPAHKRKLGYYALPLLWRDSVIGWANVTAKGGRFDAQVGFVSGAAPREKGFGSALDDELARLKQFL